MAKNGKGWYGIERTFVNLFLKETFPTCMTWKRVRLGYARDTDEEKYYKVLRRWADAIVYDGKDVYIIEAKVRPNPEGVAQLELYGQLFPKTPEFSALKDKPIKLIYLTGMTDNEIKELCESKGISYIVYQPEPIQEYWLKKYGQIPE